MCSNKECKQVNPQEDAEFRKSHGQCKSCEKEYYNFWREDNSEALKECQKKWREDNSEALKECQKKWREDNSEALKEYNKKWREDNPEHYKEYNKKWREDNPGYHKEYRQKPQYKAANKVQTAQRRAAKNKPYFKLLSKEHKQEIKDIYKEAKGLHVDHIIPLKHEQVCGLHVPRNLQLLSPTDNSRKSNKFDGTYENESWRITKTKSYSP